MSGSNPTAPTTMSYFYFIAREAPGCSNGICQGPDFVEVFREGLRKVVTYYAESAPFVHFVITDGFEGPVVWESFSSDPRNAVLRKRRNITKLPTEIRPVLALIRAQTDLGRSQWYEVVFTDGEHWKSYAGSNTFEDGEQVINWVYVTDVLGEK